MDIREAVAYLDHQITDPHIGLPPEIFLLVSSLVPLVNVDLLIQDDRQRTLLTWRSDHYCGCGWHVPGGILRFKERLEDRIVQVARNELHTSVQFDPVPLAMNQCIAAEPERKKRGHFISFLYRCHVPEGFCPDNQGLNPTMPGYAQWHNGCPDNLIKVHHIYRQYITNAGVTAHEYR